jgi:DegV family protein with EDD domain
VDITSRDIFEAVSTGSLLPKTGAVSVNDFVEFFKQISGDLIYVGISSNLSGTIQNAMIASEQLPNRNIRVIDSLNLSTGIGLQVLIGAEMRDAGKSLDEITEAVESTRTKAYSTFKIDTLDYLYKGGRCSALANIFGTILKIRPIIEVREDGTMGVKEKVRGSRNKALFAMMKDFTKHAEQIDTNRIFITHTDCDEDAVFLANELEAIMNIKDIQISKAGATISSHCGPGTIGILYYYK